MSHVRADRSRWARTIGIVGGLGPHAHVELERLLLRAAERRLGRPARDQDYPPWLVASVPQTPDRTAAIEGDASPVDEIARALGWLAAAGASRGADFAVIACNAAHAWLDELRRRSRLPILDVPGEALRVAAARAGAGTPIGLLATTGTLHARVYHEAARRLGLAAPIVTLLDAAASGEEGMRLQEEWVMTPVYGAPVDGARPGGGIKSGQFERGGETTARLRRAVARLARAGAGLVVTACTEIPLALGREPVDGVPLLDPMETAAEASLEIAAGRRDLP